MTDYTKSTNFATKDSLPAGSSLKIVRGTEIDTEFNNIATAIATKANTASPTFTGDPTAPTPSVGDNDTSIATTAFVTTAVSNAVAAGFGFKNRIINGAMVIDQRNAGASVSTGFVVDRFEYSSTQASKATLQQNSGSVTPPAGFKNYLGVVSSSAYSALSSDIFKIRQHIEGFNTADLNWGTANAATVTLSFWVRSSLTGTFGGALLNQGETRSYPFSYTISSANTWEQKIITIAGDQSGTWATDNGIGIRVTFSLGMGSTYSGTAGSWSGTRYESVTGAVSVVGTNGATFYITGVQLEKGSTATSFDYRPYGSELALCQRYFEKNYDMSVAVGSVGSAGSNYFIATATVELNGFSFKTSKRATPSVVLYSFTGAANRVNGNANAVAAGYVGESGVGYVGGSGFTVGTIGYFGFFTASAEL